MIYAMNNTQTTPDFGSLKTRARSMSDAALVYSYTDANFAAEMAEEFERQGLAVLKTGGYYRDEASVYLAEMKQRNIW